MKQLEQKILISSGEYGVTTDLQVVSDESYIYAAYEIVEGQNERKEHHVYLIKYDKYLNAVNGPVKVFSIPGWGMADEHGDDPSPCLDGAYLYLITHLDEGISPDRSFRVRKYNKDLEPVDIGSSGHIDLSTNMGKTHHSVSSEVFVDSQMYLVTQVTGTEKHPDIYVLRYDSNFYFDGYKKALHTEIGIPEMRPMGFQYEDGRFYLAYSEFKFADSARGGIVFLDVFDKSFELLQQVRVSNKHHYADHSTLEAMEDRVYVAYWEASDPELETRNIFISEYMLCDN